MTVYSLIVPPPRAVIGDEALQITQLVVRDADVLRACRTYQGRDGGEDVGDYVEALLVLGARAAALAGATVDVNEIKQHLATFTGDVASTAAASVTQINAAVAAATDAEDGHLARVIRQAMERLEKDMAQLLGGEDATVRTAITKSVSTVTEKALDEVRRLHQQQAEGLQRMLATDAPDSPLNRLKAELVTGERQTRQELMAALSDVKALVEAAKAHRATMERTAIKGLDFEQAVVQSVAEVGHGAGDTVDATGTTPGRVPRCKTGDAVVTLANATRRGAPIKLAVEAKDKSLSCQQWRLELDSARQNRDAVAALGIVRGTEHMPAGQRVLVLDACNVVVAYDPEVDDTALLYTAYHLLRAAATCAVLESGDQELDLASVQERLQKGLTALQQFDKIDSAVKNARTHLDTVEKVSSSIRQDVQKQVDGALGLMQASAA